MLWAEGSKLDTAEGLTVWSIREECGRSPMGYGRQYLVRRSGKGRTPRVAVGNLGRGRYEEVLQVAVGTGGPSVICFTFGLTPRGQAGRARNARMGWAGPPGKGGSTWHQFNGAPVNVVEDSGSFQGVSWHECGGLVWPTY